MVNKHHIVCIYLNNRTIDKNYYSNVDNIII